MNANTMNTHTHIHTQTRNILKKKKLQFCTQKHNQTNRFTNHLDFGRSTYKRTENRDDIVFASEHTSDTENTK